jgi:hypothetical protein
VKTAMRYNADNRKHANRKLSLRTPGAEEENLLWTRLAKKAK